MMTPVRVVSALDDQPSCYVSGEHGAPIVLPSFVLPGVTRGLYGKLGR
jgi:hypothetical protein